MKTANTKVNGLKNDVIKKFVKQLPQYKTYLIKDPLGFVKPMGTYSRLCLFPSIIFSFFKEMLFTMLTIQN